MKILLITACLPYPPNKGEKIRTMAILEALAMIGKVDLVAISRERMTAEQEIKLTNYCTVLKIFPINRMKALLKLPLAFLFNQSLTHNYFYISAAQKWLKQLDYHKYDLVFVVSGNIYLNITQRQTVPYYWDFIDLDSNKWLNFANTTKCFIKKLLYKREHNLINKAEQKINKETKQTFVVHQNEIEQARLNHNNIKAVVLPLVLPNSYQLPTFISKQEGLIVFSGQMDYQPNIDAVTYLHDIIFPRIKAKKPSVNFTIIGRKASNKLQQHCYNFTFTGEVNSSQDLIAKAEIYLLPLHNSVGVPTKVLEALACHVPIVMNREIGKLYNLQDRVHYLATDTEEELVLNTLELLDNKELALELAKNSYNLLKKELSIQSLVAVLSKLV